MSNLFTTNPVYLDTDTTTGAGTNWRGANGGQLLTPNIKGILPTVLVIAPAAGGTATVAGTVVVNDPQQSAGNLFSIGIEATMSVPVVVSISGSLWRDFIVTGLTATKVALQIFYK